jgi:hypothetical protein
LQCNNPTAHGGYKNMRTTWGAGILVLLIVFLSSLAANLISNFVGGKGYWELHSWPLATALSVAGCLIWIADMYFFKHPWPELVHERTGERGMLDHKNDFFIRMVGLNIRRPGIVILITNTVRGIW